MALLCAKYYLHNVFLFHLYLVVVGTQVKFGEKIGSVKFIQDIINNWDGEFFFDG